MLDHFVAALALMREPAPDAKPATPPAPRPATVPERAAAREDSPPAPARRAAPPVAPPVVFQRADASGQLWHHADPAALDAWIAARNAQLVRPASAPAAYRPCPGGRCPR